MALTTNETNQVRVDVLGVSVDQSTTWTTTGPSGNRNALDAAITERVVTRLLNDLYARLGGAIGGTNLFGDRFNAVIGDEAGADQVAFDSLGTNLIQALAAGGVAAAPEVIPITTANTVWSLPHNLGQRFVSIQTIDDAGNLIIGDPNYVDANNATVTFSRAVAGTAVVRK